MVFIHFRASAIGAFVNCVTCYNKTQKKIKVLKYGVEWISTINKIVSIIFSFYKTVPNNFIILFPAILKPYKLPIHSLDERRSFVLRNHNNCNQALRFKVQKILSNAIENDAMKENNMNLCSHIPLLYKDEEWANVVAKTLENQIFLDYFVIQ